MRVLSIPMRDRCQRDPGTEGIVTVLWNCSLMEWDSVDRNDVATLSTTARVTAVLAFVAEHPERVELGGCAQELRLPRSTVHRIFQELCREGYLARGQGRGAYRIGPGLVRMASRIMGGLRLVQQARPVLERLSRELATTTFLAVPAEGRVICVDSVEQPGGVRFYVEVGKTLPVHASAPAKVLAALAPEEGLLAALTFEGPRTPHTLSSEAELLAELERVRAAGYAVCDEELETGVCALAAPVTDGRQRVVAAVAVLSTTRSLPAMSRDAVLRHLLEAAASISRALGSEATVHPGTAAL